jgi:hypothetical protein
MIRFICDHCGTPFDEPVKVEYSEAISGEITRHYTEERCPICGCDSFSNAKLCPDCGAPMTADRIICKNCAEAYMERINECFDHFTADGEEWFNEMMTHYDIDKRREWAWHL